MTWVGSSGFHCRWRHGPRHSACSFDTARLVVARETVKVDRSTLFGNPFLTINYASGRAVALFRAWITARCADVACRQ